MNCAAIALCAIYAASVAFGFISSDVLPTATIFRLLPRLSHWEPYAPLVVLFVAAAGAITSWLGAIGYLDTHVIRRNEIRLCRLWYVAGLPALVCAGFFSLSAGGWAGLFRKGDLNAFGILSIVPHSDAFGYIEASYIEAATGRWSQFGARRPVAQALRDLTLFISGHSYLTMLSLQVLLVAVFLFIAGCSIARWRGHWPAVAFVGFVWIIERPFVATAATEPLALILTLASLPFLLDAYARRSAPHMLLALVGLSVALLVRMGNLLLIPLMIVLVPFSFSTASLKWKWLLLIGVGITCGIAVESFALVKFYSPPGAAMGGNFAWTLCGLATGTDWGHCWNKFFVEASTLNPNDEHGISLYILNKTLQIFSAHPIIFFHSIYANMLDFLSDVPHFLLNGYIPPDHQVGFSTAKELALLTIPGLSFAAIWRMSNAERWLWLGVFGTTTVAAGLVFADGGVRVLIVTNVLIAYLFALGFTSPVVVTPGRYVNPAPSPSWRAVAIACVSLLAVLLVAPAVWRAAIKEQVGALAMPPLVANQVSLLGGRYLMGFIVVADDDQRRYSVPTVRLSEFDKLFTQAGLFDNPSPLLARARARVPFAFVCSPGSVVIGGPTGNYYLAPSEVLQRVDVKAWRLTLDASAIPPSSDIRIYEVVNAEPISGTQAPVQ